MGDAIKSLGRLDFEGPPVAANQDFGRLPDALKALLEDVNGFIALNGALHVRGMCSDPAWHSLQQANDPETGVRAVIQSIGPDDVVFAQSCYGDQFLLRRNEVWRVDAETGRASWVSEDLDAFFRAAVLRKDELLRANLLGLLPGGQRLQPGNLVIAMPPFIADTDGETRLFGQGPAARRLQFLGEIQRKLAHLPEGTRIRFKAKPRQT